MAIVKSTARKGHSSSSNADKAASAAAARPKSVKDKQPKEPKQPKQHRNAEALEAEKGAGKSKKAKTSKAKAADPDPDDEAADAADALPVKKSRSSKKQRKEPVVVQLVDPDESEEEEGEEARIDADEEAEEDQELDDDKASPEEAAEDEEGRKNGKTDAQIEKEAITRRKTKARRRGYRYLAATGGFSAAYSSPDASRDVAANIFSLNEVVRACKWMPGSAEKVSFADINEFEERARIAQEPLPKGAAEVFRASMEVFSRKVMLGAVKIAFAEKKHRITPNIMARVTEEIQGGCRYSFEAPLGVIRFAQSEAPHERIPTFEDDDVDMQPGGADAQQVALQQKIVAKHLANTVVRNQAKKAATLERITKKKAEKRAERKRLAAGGEPAPVKASKKRKA